MYTYAITTVTYHRRSLFTRTTNADLLMETLFAYREEGRFLLHGFAIMPEHLHALLTPCPGQTVERCVQCIKGGFSFSLKRRFPGTIWQPGFHEHRVRNREDFLNQADYISRNPLRRGLDGYQYVHTHCRERMDAMPEYFSSQSG